MTDSESSLSVRKLSRRFGYRHVIADISFDVSGGDFLLLMGHNGAGKTTLIRLLAGLLKPNSGSVVRPHSFGLVAHESMLYDSLTARENLRFFGRLLGKRAEECEDQLLEKIGLAEHADRLVASYSRGMVQRLTLARALLRDPELLLLDEPMTGLDDAASGTLKEILTDSRSRKRIVVLATHQLADVIGLATDVGFLVSGRMKAIEPIAGRDATTLTRRYRELAGNV